jgi:predicted PurR-regulated permease PerM
VLVVPPFTGHRRAVAGLYGLCSAIENYVIAPRVYGHHLKLSRVAVVLASQ